MSSDGHYEDIDSYGLQSAKDDVIVSHTASPDDDDNTSSVSSHGEYEDIDSYVSVNFSLNHVNVSHTTSPEDDDNITARGYMHCSVVSTDSAPHEYTAIIEQREFFTGTWHHDYREFIASTNLLLRPLKLFGFL